MSTKASTSARVEKLERHRNWIAAGCTIFALVAGAWAKFGMMDPVAAANESVSKLTTKHEKLAGDIGAMEATIKSLHEKVRSAEAAADRAMQKAGEIEEAVAEAQRHATEAVEARDKARDALALAGDLDRNLRGYDSKIAWLRAWASKMEQFVRGRAPGAKPVAKAVPKRRIIQIQVNASNAVIRLTPGDSALDEYTISSSNYVAEYGVPVNAVVLLKVEAPNVVVVADPRLKGRVSPQPGKRASNFVLRYGR